MTEKTRRAVPYALLELETGNFVGFYETEQAALEDVVDSIDRYGAASVDTLALAHSTSGNVQPISEGKALAERALTAVRGSGRETNETTAARTSARLCVHA